MPPMYSYLGKPNSNGPVRARQRAKALEAIITCTHEMLLSADKADASEYVRLQMNLQSFYEEYKILTGREYPVGGR